MAKSESCVIVGRCADYVLKDFPNVVSVFIHADKEFCLEQAMERNSMSPKEMQRFIEKTDKYRGDFYKYYTGHEWSDARNYHLCLDSGKLGFEKCVQEIKSYMNIRFGGVEEDNYQLRICNLRGRMARSQTAIMATAPCRVDRRRIWKGENITCGWRTPRSQFVRIPGAGHMGIYERLEAYNRLTWNFLRRRGYSISMCVEILST